MVILIWICFNDKVSAAIKKLIDVQGRLQGLKADKGVPIVLVLTPSMLGRSFVILCSICFCSSIAEI